MVGRFVHQKCSRLFGSRLFFGRDLHKYQNVPIGLIDTSWGGTYIETWTSKEALATMPDMQKKLDVLKELPISSEDREKKFHSDVEDWKRRLKRLIKDLWMAEPYGQLQTLKTVHGKQ